MRPEVRTTVEKRLNQLHEQYLAMGYEDVDSYYPAELESERHRFGVAYCSLDDSPIVGVGDDDFAFPLHSICKVFLHAVALEDNGRDATLERVGVEPSGEAFNAFVFDERANRPFNPMVNAGALVTAELVNGRDRDEKVARVVEKLRRYAANPKLHVDQDILDYELEHNDRNLGLGYLMRSQGMLDADTDVAETMAVYLSICAVKVTAKDLSIMGATLANSGVNPLTEEHALERKYARDVLTVMFTCGMYDAAGQWAYDVGLPAKSGVSGGIIVAMPDRFGLCLFSPGLDVYGNSVRGVAVCRDLTKHYGLHALAPLADDQLSRG